MGLQMLGNPLVLAAFAIAAVGFAVYEIVSNQNRRQQHQHRRRAPSPPRRPPPSPPAYPKKPETETSVKRKSSDVTSSCTPKRIESSDTTSSNLRKRTSQTESNTKLPDSSSEKFVVLNQDNVDEENLDIKDYNKNVLDKIQNDVKKSISFEKNITEDPDRPEQNVQLDDKESNTPSIVASTTTDASASASHSISDADSDNMLKEEIYKEEIFDTLKNDIEFNKKAGHSEDMGNYASGNESTEFLNPSRTPPGICKACEENPINARAYPCNHDYLCLDCAVKMLRLFRKCTICYTFIREFREIES